MALTDNLVSYYKFDASNSNDSVGSNNGTDTTITYSSGNGKINNGAGFNGVASKISLGNSTTLTPGAITIAAWINLTSLTGAPQICSRDYADSGNANTRNYQFRVFSSKIEFIPFNASTNGDVAGATTLSTGTWYYAVATWDGTTEKVYLNGAEDGSNAFSGTLRSGGTSNTFIGCAQNGGAGLNSDFFSGAIDEVAIWSRALSAAEITSLYNSGAGLQYPFTSSVVMPRKALLGVGN